MRKLSELPPITNARRSPRMMLRANLKPQHNHPADIRRTDLAADFTDPINEQLELALALLANLHQTTRSRAISSSLMVLGNLILAGLLTWLFLQANSFFPQSPLMRLFVFVLCLAGLALVFLSIVSAFRSIVYWWHQGSGAQPPISAIFSGGLSGAPQPLDSAAIQATFLRSTRKKLLEETVSAVAVGTSAASAQAANLRYAVQFLLLAIGAFLLLVFLAGFGLV